jgi:DNA-binding MarR family transcriptional regulator
MRARKAGRIITQLYDGYLRQAGVTSPQYALLRYIGATEGVSLGELGHALCLEQSTATRNVELLKGKGYVSLVPKADDRRKKILSLTDAGREKLANATLLWQKAQDQVRMELGEAAMEALVQAFKDVAALTKAAAGGRADVNGTDGESS